MQAPVGVTPMSSEYFGAHNGKPPSDCAKCCWPLMEIYRYDGADCGQACFGLCCMTCTGCVGGAMLTGGWPLGPCGAWAYMFTCWEPKFAPLSARPDCCMKCFCPMLEVYRYEGCSEALCMAWLFGCCFTMCCWEPRRMAMQQPMVVVQSQQHQQGYSPPIMQMADRNQDVRLTASAPDGFVVMAQAVNPAADSLAAAAHQAEARAAELRAAMPRSEQPELVAHGEPFPLTLQDMFTRRFVVEVTPRTRVFEVKELVRLQKAEPVESVDTMLLLFDTQPLDDDTTVGSHGLSAETTVTLSNQNPAKGREQRRLRGERALRERELQEAEEEAVRARAAADAAASPLAASAQTTVATPVMASAPPSPTVSPSFAVQAHVELSLASVLEEAMLTQYGDALREFGAVEWQDLAELEEADAASLGIRRLEFRRLMRVVESHAGG